METLPMYILRRPAKNGVWYFRRPIPKELQPFIDFGNRDTFTVSLKTKNLKEALPLHHVQLAESERLLEEARQRAKTGFPIKHQNGVAKDSLKKRPLSAFSKEELTCLVQKWYLKAQAEALEVNRAIFSSADAEERRETLSELELELAKLEGRDTQPNFEPYRVMREIMEEAGGYLEAFTPGNKVIEQMWFLAVVKEALIRRALFAQGVLTRGIPPVFEDASPELSTVALAKAANAPASITLDQLIERFEKDPSREEVKPKTRDEFKLVYAMLREAIGGNTPIANITREQLRDLQGVYRELPPNFKKLYPGKTMKEVAELAKRDGREPLGRATFNKRFTLLSGVFNYAEREQLLTSSPAQGLKLKGGASKAEGEKSFGVDQLNLIFSGPLYQDFVQNSQARFTPKHELNPHEFWVPLMALFQGMRMEEALQLREDDILEQDCVLCIRIRKAEGQSVKTEASIRMVPVHPQLKQLGFVGYLKAIRAGGFKELFPEATRGKTYGNLSHNYSKKALTYLKEVGVWKKRTFVFHSFRHTFNDGLRMQGVPEDVRCRLGGWTTGKRSVESTYGGRVLPYLSEQLAKLKYEALELSHLMPIGL